MRLGIQNFRSIQRQEVELAPITVVYGPNGAGKSSLLYALLTMRNIVMNPNQGSGGFLNFGYANLGDYEAVVFDHQKGQEIELSLDLTPTGQQHAVRYQVTIGGSQGGFALSIVDLDIALRLSVSFPYPANQPRSYKFELDDIHFQVVWNGLIAKVSSAGEDSQAQENANSLAHLLNAPVESLRRIAIVPLKRGFSKPMYSQVAVPPMPTTGDQIASLLAGDKYLVGKVSHYLESIFDCDFRIQATLGTAMFSLDSRDRNTGIVTELVNDGFGVNQTVHLLAQCLHEGSAMVCIEEPETHMHPSAVRRMARAFVQMKREEDKSFIISTHSEQLVLAFLTLVAKKELAPSELACYLARKEQKATVFERQQVSENGQIDGGLGPFMEGELEDVKTFLGVSG